MTRGLALRRCEGLFQRVASRAAGSVLRESHGSSYASWESHGWSHAPRESRSHDGPQLDQSCSPPFRAIRRSRKFSSSSSERSGGNSRGGDSLSLPGVKHIVAVASAKGGVGKSTTAVNLAVALSHHLRLRVGLLDADVFGPSLPKLLGLESAGRPLLASPSPGSPMLPLQAYGLLCMSMGFLMPADVAAVWRGPMVMAAVEKLLRGTKWGRLDVLVVDMPPGTGDVQLSLSQRARLSGALIVSTPQDLALMDARRGVTMFRQVNVPVLGLVENMSYFTCPECAHRSHIFGHGGAREAATELGIEFIAEVPLLPSIRSRSDSGHPVALGEAVASEGEDWGAEGPGAECGGATRGEGAGGEAAVVGTYERMARRVWEKLEEQAQAGGAAQGPTIVND
ncbi:hypothetical protein CLOM_g23829 [Closterium sp. NIES-68]|nr:hypothetical protein CLOM_g23829 [Closterium sp. NIES-68]GJP81532.1 hypothetical protein CLOP_g11674 [Closterium sp. NIES-67]